MSNSILFLLSIPCSLFRRIASIPYLSRIQNKERKNACVQYSLIYKIDVTLRRRLRKLHVSARTAAVFTRITIFDDVSLRCLQRHSYFNTINVIPIDSIPYLPRIRDKK